MTNYLSNCVLIIQRIKVDPNNIPVFNTDYVENPNGVYVYVAFNVGAFQQRFRISKLYRNNHGVLEIEIRDFIPPRENMTEEEIEEAMNDPNNYGPPYFIRAMGRYRIVTDEYLEDEEILVKFQNHTLHLRDNEMVYFGEIDNPALTIITDD